VAVAPCRLQGLGVFGFGVLRLILVSRYLAATIGWEDVELGGCRTLAQARRLAPGGTGRAALHRALGRAVGPGRKLASHTGRSG
jgi:hypothetical protein